MTKQKNCCSRKPISQIFSKSNNKWRDLIERFVIIVLYENKVVTIMYIVFISYAYI